MWIAKNPTEDLEILSEGSNFGRILCLRSTYESLSKGKRSLIEKDFSVSYSLLENPNNPAKTLKVILIEAPIKHE